MDSSVSGYFYVRLFYLLLRIFFKRDEIRCLQFTFYLTFAINFSYLFDAREEFEIFCEIYFDQFFIFSFSISFRSDETSTINHQIECIDPNFWHPPHLENAGDNESNSYYPNLHINPNHECSRRANVSKVFDFADPSSFPFKTKEIIQINLPFSIKIDLLSLIILHLQLNQKRKKNLFCH